MDWCPIQGVFLARLWEMPRIHCHPDNKAIKSNYWKWPRVKLINIFNKVIPVPISRDQTDGDEFLYTIM